MLVFDNFLNNSILIVRMWLIFLRESVILNLI